MEPILTLENLCKYYVNGKNVVTGLNRVNLSFSRGEFVAITGESGSGKSTLAHILGGILPYEDGELYVNGNPTAHYDSADWEAYRRDNVAFISQNYGILPGATVRDNVVSALYLAGLDKKEAAARAQEILEVVELWPLRRRPAAKLSSGQKQRLAIARALAKPCPILIADEPTGNLDLENSEKVIRLLAQAAKERLVILITHEFSEAESYVTRHVRIHDGRVSGDIRLRDLEEAEPIPAPRKPRNLSAYIAGLQLHSRPVWAASVLLFFTLTAFAVFAFLGSFIVALDDTSTRVYDDSAFVNGDMIRIVAVRKDDADMTQADFNTILALENVASLERYGYIADYIYAYQEGVDYTFHYTNANVGSDLDPVYEVFSSVEVRNAGQFVRTVPLYAVETEFLTAGRLPESFLEVVAGDEALLGQQVTVYLRDFKNWSRGEYIKLDATVVGTTDAGTGLYFSDEVGELLTWDYLSQNNAMLAIPWYGEVYSDVVFSPVRSTSGSMLGVKVYPRYMDSYLRPLQDDEKLISMSLFSSNWIWGMEGFDLAAGFAGYRLDTTKGAHDSTYRNLLAVSPTVFAAYLEDQCCGWGNQVSITITDYAYTDRVIAALEQAGYYAMSPYVLGSAVVDEALAAKRTQTLAVCLGALAAVILLQLILIRALFSMELESYRVLYNMGLTWRSAQGSVWLQIFVFAVLGQIFGLGAIALAASRGITRITDLTVYLDSAYWLLLSAVHLAASVLAAWGVRNNLKKKVYPLSARRSDLAPGSKEAAG